MADAYRRLLLALSQGATLHDVARLTAELALDLVDADGASVTRVEGRELEYIAAVGSVSDILGRRIPIEDSFSGITVRSAAVRLFDRRNAPQSSRRRAETDEVGSGVVAPIMLGEKAIGTLGVVKKAESFFMQDDALILSSLAGYIALGLERVRAQVDFFRLVHTAPVGIIIIRKGKLIFANPAWAASLGRGDPGGLLGTDLAELVCPDHRWNVEQWLTSDYKDAGPGTWHEADLLHHGGKRIAHEISAPQLIHHEGEPATLLICRDTSERKHIEERFIEAQKMEAVGLLAAGVAHDFNNLLTAIGGHASLLLDEIEPAGATRDSLMEIQNAVDQASSLTHRLLAYGRRQVIKPRPVDLGEIVENMKMMLGRLIGENVDLVADLPPDLPAVEADPVQVGQILMNLAINARDAMDRGGRLTLRAEVLDLGRTKARRIGVGPGRHVRLTLADTGQGMDPATAARAFEPFFTTKKRGRGTGLGLSTVYGIMVQSGGAVTLDSEVDQGTSVHLTFPVTDEPVQEAKRTTPPTTSTRGTETVLVVEDDPQVGNVVCKALGKSGYNVLTTESPDEALGLFEKQSERIDLLIADVVMPGMSGPDLARRAVALQPDLKVIFMSGYSDEAIEQHGHLTPGSEFVHKPFEIASMVHMVRRMLDE